MAAEPEMQQAQTDRSPATPAQVIIVLVLKEDGPQSIALDGETVQRFSEVAEQTNRPLAEVIREHLAAVEPKREVKEGSSFLLSIAGIGSSGERDISARVDDILAAEIDRVEGWGVRRDSDT